MVVVGHAEINKKLSELWFVQTQISTHQADGGWKNLHLSQESKKKKIRIKTFLTFCFAIENNLKKDFKQQILKAWVLVKNIFFS